MRTVIIVMAVIFSAAALFVTALTVTLPTERSAGGHTLAPEEAPTASPSPLKPAANSSLRQRAGKTQHLPVPQPAGSIYGESEDSDSEEAVQRPKEDQETPQTLASDQQQDSAALESELERRDQGSEIEHIREKQTADGEEMRQRREELALPRQVVKHRGVKEKVAAAPVAPPSEAPGPVEGQQSREAPLIPVTQHPPPRFTVVSGSEEGGRVIAILGGGAFPSGQETPSEDLLQAIRNLLPEIVINADSMIIVEGHADSMPTKPGQEGSLAGNKALSLQRAESVALLLEGEGVDPSRISIAGLGATQPLAPNTTADGRAENRRVEIRLIPTSSERGAVQKRKD